MWRMSRVHVSLLFINWLNETKFFIYFMCLFLSRDLSYQNLFIFTTADVKYCKCPKILNTLFCAIRTKLCFLCSCFLTQRNGKQCRSWSDCSFRSSLWRSSLIWVCTICICHFVSNFGVQNFGHLPYYVVAIKMSPHFASWCHLYCTSKNSDQPTYFCNLVHLHLALHRQNNQSLCWVYIS